MCYEYGRTGWSISRTLGLILLQILLSRGLELNLVFLTCISYLVTLSSVVRMKIFQVLEDAQHRSNTL
jgi:hypothetical protein